MGFCFLGRVVHGGLTLLFSPIAIVSDVISNVFGGNFPGATKELFNRFAATIGHVELANENGIMTIGLAT